VVLEQVAAAEVLAQMEVRAVVLTVVLVVLGLLQVLVVHL
jgi:hypothetical protein